MKAQIVKKTFKGRKLLNTVTTFTGEAELACKYFQDIQERAKQRFELKKSGIDLFEYKHLTTTNSFKRVKFQLKLQN